MTGPMGVIHTGRVRRIEPSDRVWTDRGLSVEVNTDRALRIEPHGSSYKPEIIVAVGLEDAPCVS